MLHTPRSQQTLSRAAAVEGIGYWSGADVRVEFRPAAPHTGLVFVRGDLRPAVRIPALVEQRIDVPRRTALRQGSATVEMVEHILAALWALRVDNCEIWVNSAEMPGCDGSSLPFVEAIQSAGIVAQPARQPYLAVSELTRIGTEECWVEASPATKPGLSIRYRLDYGSDHPIGRQTYELEITPSSFLRELAPCRTFIMREEAEQLRAQNLGARTTFDSLLCFDREGLVGNTLRFDDECVRHKMLDVVGDLALIGCDLIGQVRAYRSGHRLNAELVRMVLAEGRVQGGRRRSA